MKIYSNFIRLKENKLPDFQAIETVLNSPGTSEDVKKGILDFVTALGYRTANFNNSVTLFEPSTFDTWEIRAESKMLLAINDLEDLTKYYEGKTISEAGYTECDVKEIIDFAKELPLYAKHRSEAVRYAYIRWNLCKKNGLEITNVPFGFDEDYSEEKEEEAAAD